MESFSKGKIIFATTKEQSTERLGYILVWFSVQCVFPY